jgi:hypothetical protein
MYSIINFYTWLQIIDELFLLDGTYPKSLKLWRSAAESLKAENDIRARLAHHAISQDEEKIGGNKTYKVEARHARLAVHAAHTMTVFVLETWEARKKNVRGI